MRSWFKQNLIERNHVTAVSHYYQVWCVWKKCYSEGSEVSHSMVLLRYWVLRIETRSACTPYAWINCISEMIKQHCPTQYIPSYGSKSWLGLTHEIWSLQRLDDSQAGILMPGAWGWCIRIRYDLGLSGNKQLLRSDINLDLWCHMASRDHNKLNSIWWGVEHLISLANHLEFVILLF